MISESTNYRKEYEDPTSKTKIESDTSGGKNKGKGKGLPCHGCKAEDHRELDGGLRPACVDVHVRNLVLSCCGANNRMGKIAKEKGGYNPILITESDDLRITEAQRKAMGP